ncbi:MAG TPA: M23 family metallopeptidase [Candidatus Lustribacter sp.]|nr:M23 family metallopeptidase [Candidatus Lustribacter sp.]
MTDNAFLIKIIPPEGYNVYRLHVSRTLAVAVLFALVAFVGAALGFHAWQLHLAEDDVQALQAITVSQHEKLQAIDRQADSLAGELRDIQRQDNEIRRLLGVHAAPALPAAPVHPTHGFVSGAHATTTVAQVQDRLARLVHASEQRLSDSSTFERLTHRVLDLRRLAQLARERMLASLPSLNPDGGTITAGFGWRVNPWPEFHQGVDLAADYGTPVHAAADGVVRSAGWDGGFGIKIDIDHENGYRTWYAHLSRVAVAPGTHVRKGDTIGFVGATGEATGPHVHFQIMLNGRPIDPVPYLNGVPAKVLATLPGAGGVQ